MHFIEFTLLTCLSLGAFSTADAAPRVFLLDGKALVEMRSQSQAGDEKLVAALDALRKEAEAALTEGPYSVMDKPFTPPSGDKHDYMSVGPYWWPDPEKEDGLPYIRKDGVVNPERNKYDNVGMGKMQRNVKTLAYAYWFAGEERYAAQAAKLLRTWYLDEATRMNPNLNFGQAIPGRVKGRGVGIIDTGSLPQLLDAVGLLAGSAAWTEADQAGLVQWFRDYIEWLTTHKYGIDEGRAKNNHGTYYDMQVVAYALFVGDEALVKEVLSEVPARRIAPQIEPDGRQPHELARTNSYGYSVMNLRGMFFLARLGEHVGIDLWHFETDDGRSIREALDWIVAHAFGEGEWTHQNLKPISPGSMLPLLWQASQVYDHDAHAILLDRLGGGHWPRGRDALLYSGGR